VGETMKGDDVSLEFHEDGYPRLPDRLDRRPKPLVEDGFPQLVINYELGLGALSEASGRLLRGPFVPFLNRRTPLAVCNRDCSSSEPHAGVDTPAGNCHTCDIHFAISAYNFSKRKGPREGRTQLS
jgi:hypothetical protein